MVPATASWPAVVSGIVAVSLAWPPARSARADMPVTPKASDGSESRALDRVIWPTRDEIAKGPLSLRSKPRSPDSARGVMNALASAACARPVIARSPCPEVMRPLMLASIPPGPWPVTFTTAPSASLTTEPESESAPGNSGINRPRLRSCALMSKTCRVPSA